MQIFKALFFILLSVLHINAEISGFSFKIINIFPHDIISFTQGLVYHRGTLTEGTGLKGKSLIKRTNIKTGMVYKKIKLPRQYFGEGITIIGNNLYQLTWQSQTGFIYNDKTLKKTGTFKYSGEGWGLTSNGRDLIMSNGSNEILFLDTAEFKTIKRIQVIMNGKPVNRINELEYVKGTIFANIWQSDTIMAISEKDGNVTGTIDLSSLHAYLRKKTNRYGVANGIAYNSKADTYYVTGKNWPLLFEIRLFPGK